MSEKLFITDAQIAGFAKTAGITRNVLCVLPKCAQAEQPFELTKTQQAALSAALRPKCVTRAELLLHNDGLMMLLCAGRSKTAALIGRKDDKNILVPVESGDFATTLLAYLMEDGEPNSAEASIKTSSDSFLMLLATADTYRRRYLAGLLNHKAQQPPLTPDDLKKTLTEAYNESDTRWLFPFVLMTLEYPIIEDMQAALDGLISGGILEADSLTLTADGERLFDELMYLQTALHIQTRRVRGDALMQEDVLLLRTRESLWCAICGEGETTLFTLAAEKMCEIVNAILEELDEPRDDIQAVPEQEKQAAHPAENGWRCACGSVNEGAFCPKCGKPKPIKTAPAKDSWQCVCGSVNKGSFCPKCGAKRFDVSAAPTDGSWLCACGRTNKGSFCPKCGAKRPQ